MNFIDENESKSKFPYKKDTKQVDIVNAGIPSAASVSYVMLKI